MYQVIYLLGLLFSIPLLPFLKLDGKKVRQSVPSLEPPSDINGTVPSDIKSEKNILFIGESTIAGIGVDSHADGIAGYFCKRYYELTGHPCSWTVTAKSGYTAAQVNKKLLKHIPSNNYDVIVIGLGANDSFTLNSPRQWGKEIKKLITYLQNEFKGTPVLFLNMPPIKAFPAMTGLLRLTIGNLVELLGARLKQIINKRSGVYFNAERIKLDTWSRKYELPINDPSVYFSDGIHPAQKTYEIWAYNAIEYLIRKGIIS